MDQVSVNEAVWRRAEHVRIYANRVLAPVEVALLLRYRDELSRRAIEVGCGAGRILGYLAALGGEAHGVDLSPAMVDYCRRAYPAAHVRVGNVMELRALYAEPFDAILAANNLIDVFDDDRRTRLLAELHRCLVPGGLLIFSSHNLAALKRAPGPAHRPLRARALSVAKVLMHKSPVEVAAAARRAPVAMRNRRRLGALERTAPDHAIVNDGALSHALLHYYARRDVQVQQLDRAGFDLVECLDADARPVPPGQDSRDPWLFYVARRRLASGP